MLSTKRLSKEIRKNFYCIDKILLEALSSDIVELQSFHNYPFVTLKIYTIGFDNVRQSSYLSLNRANIFTQ